MITEPIAQAADAAPSTGVPIEQEPPYVLHAIVNPVAGSGRAARRWPELSRALTQHGYAIQAHFTRQAGDATHIARRLARQGANIIVSVGGDGTVNEVVNGLIEDDQPVNPETRLALIPCGTGKDLGRTLGVRPSDAALAAIDHGVSARVDVGRMRYIDGASGQPVSRYFVNVADTGLGAEVAARINAGSKRLGGLASYLVGAVRTIAVFQFRDATIELDGVEFFAGKSGMVVFANGRFFAGGMVIAPDASLCDGLLEVFVLEDVGKRALLTSLLPRVYRGKHVGRPGVLHRSASSASVRSSRQMLVELDGEQVGEGPLEVAVLPKVLRLIGAEEALIRAGGCVELPS